jgi:hypothetical protein
VVSYCCFSVDSPLPSSNGKPPCDSFRFFGFGIGVMNSALRREWMTCCVGWPCASSSQCWLGFSYGELRMGRSKNALLKSKSSFGAGCEPNQAIAVIIPLLQLFGAQDGSLDCTVELPAFARNGPVDRGPVHPPDRRGRSRCIKEAEKPGRSW